MKKQCIVIDVGNTHTVFGVFENGDLIYSWRIVSDFLRTEDEYFSILKSLAIENGFDLKNTEYCSLSSVVPGLTRVFKHMIQKYLQCAMINVDGYTDLGLTYPMDDPGFIGSDLIVNAFAAKEKYNTSCIVCDFGTATTIQLVGKDGYFYGTSICPGVLTSASKLFEKASLLSNIQLTTPEKILGTNTPDALRSGIIKGNALMIDGFIREIKENFKHLEDIKAIATGGISKLIFESSNEIDIVDRTLTLNGLYLICERLRSS